MNITIREYQDNDLEDVNNLLKENFNHVKNNFKNNNYKEIVAILNNQAVGYILLTKVYNPIKEIYYYLMDYVCVSSKCRKMGIGKRMLEYVNKISKKDNISYIQLTCSINRIAAHKLYESSGYIKRESDIFRKEII